MTAWLYNLIPLLPVAFTLCFLLRRKLFPPSPAEVLTEAHARLERAREAAVLAGQLKNSSKLGLVAHGAKGVYATLKSRVRDKDKDREAEVGIMKGLEGSARLAGLVGGARVELERDEKAGVRRASSESARAEGSGTVTPEEPSTPSVGEVPKVTPSIYRLAADVLRVAGSPAQEYLGQGADLLEQVKNVYLHPDHPAVGPILLRLGAICLVLLLVPAWIQIKGAWAYLGLEFFVLWRLRELYPEYRRALTPAHVLLLGAPTDAQYATYLLHRRAVEGRPLRGAKTLKRTGKQRVGATADPAARKDEPFDDSRSTYSVARSTFSFGRTHSRASSFADHDDGDDVVGSECGCLGTPYRLMAA